MLGISQVPLRQLQTALNTKGKKVYPQARICRRLTCTRMELKLSPKTKHLGIHLEN